MISPAVTHPVFQLDKFNRQSGIWRRESDIFCQPGKAKQKVLAGVIPGASN
jgi:hypothetical protein